MLHLLLTTLIGVSIWRLLKGGSVTNQAMSNRLKSAAQFLLVSVVAVLILTLIATLILKAY